VSPADDLTIEEVIHAYECCRRQKRSAWTAIEFETNFSRNIMDIYHRVRDCTWQPDGHMCFVVMNPKPPMTIASASSLVRTAAPVVSSAVTPRKSHADSSILSHRPCCAARVDADE